MSRKRVESGFHISGPAPRERPGPVTGGDSSDAVPTLLTAAEVARLWRDAMKDKSYRAFPLGLEAGHYLRAKRKRLTTSSYRDYESCLDKLARYFADLEIGDLEPPVGTQRVEDFLDAQWGESAGRTYNKNLSILRDFFKFQVLRGKPSRRPHAARSSGPASATSTGRRSPTTRSVRSSPPRTSCAIGSPSGCCLNYGLRKGALKAIQFKHFDHHRKRLTVFTKGEKVRELPIPHPEFWFDLERLILESEAQPSHYLMQRQMTPPRSLRERQGVEYRIHRWPDQPMGDHGLHNWWYACLERAGIVAVGTTSGERMHKARHTAGQRVLEATGNLKATQKLLGHASIQTTGDVYADWDIDQLAETMRAVLEGE